MTGGPHEFQQGDVKTLGELMDHLGSEPEGLRRYRLCNKRQVAQTTNGSQDDSLNVERPAFPSGDIRNRPVPAILLQVPEKSRRVSCRPEVSVSYSSEDTYTFFCPRVISCGRQQQFWYGI